MSEHGTESSLKIGVFYDGVTFKLISDYYCYAHPRQARLAFRGLHSFIETAVARDLGSGRVTESHLFIGISPSRPEGSDGLHLARPFEQAMANCGVEPHYLRRTRFGEKGVDLELGLEMLMAGVTRRIDVAVLVATDGDFAPLADRMRAIGVPVVLVGFHLPQAVPRPICLSLSLTDAASRVLFMPALIDRPAARDRELVNQLFVQPACSGVEFRRCA